ncbi:hypothetical protein [Longimycelium tulufanense]|uniref:hypothetical protein n=1 Tax=Longimycelium tulufanense TaxID=907463 RepID=UPI00166C825F|nr:hypothetical protein [Longimycelium tulufanense]
MMVPLPSRAISNAGRVVCPLNLTIVPVSPLLVRITGTAGSLLIRATNTGIPPNRVISTGVLPFGTISSPVALSTRGIRAPSPLRNRGIGGTA